jgi:dual specificity protein kinase YAK1
MDKNDDHHLLRLKDTFIHRQHLCLVFELLSVNLYELIKQNQFRGLSTTLVRVFAQQLLTGLALLSKAKLIHCDLKPENILLKKYVLHVVSGVANFAVWRARSSRSSTLDRPATSGRRCTPTSNHVSTAPRRSCLACRTYSMSSSSIFDLPRYSAAIDMWSLGCIVVELFLGLPLFPGSSEYNQVARITEMLGLPPVWMLDMGKQSNSFFEKATDEFGRRTYRLKSMEQYSRENKTKEQPSKKYFTATTLPDIIKNYPMPRKNMKPHEIDRGMTTIAPLLC